MGALSLLLRLHRSRGAGILNENLRVAHQFDTPRQRQIYNTIPETLKPEEENGELENSASKKYSY
jgi:hypothetical protein